MNVIAARSLPDSTDRRIEQILRRQYGVIARRQALATGMPSRSIDHRVNSGDWKAVYRGVYRMSAVEFGWHQRLMAAYLLVGEPTAISRRAAGGLWSFEGIDPGVVELTTPDFRRRVPRDFELHTTDAFSNADLARIGPLVVTTPTRTLIDLGACLDEERLEIASEDAFRRGLSSPTRVMARLETLASKGRPGVGRIRDVMSKWSTRGTRSLLEVKVVRLLRAARVPKPITKYWVKLQDGSKCEIDLAYPDVLLAIEVDSVKYHSQPSDLQSDRAKRNALTRKGWRVVHVTWDDVNQRPREVVELIRGLLGVPIFRK